MSGSAVNYLCCHYCGCLIIPPNSHPLGSCPAVAEIEFHEDGTIKRIVKMTAYIAAHSAKAGEGDSRG